MPSPNLNVPGEMNRQMQGLLAQVEQLSHNVAGIHKVTSRFREIAQASIPALSEIAPMLDKTPAGLALTADNVAGELMAYAEKMLDQTMGKFTNPTIAGITDAAGEIQEGQLQGIANQIASAVLANPVVALVDGLKSNISALQELPPTPAITAQIGALQAQVESMTASNPVVREVADLRSAAQDIAGSISTYTSFLSAQKNIISGITRSFKVG